jgi:hypothetical protein
LKELVEVLAHDGEELARSRSGMAASSATVRTRDEFEKRELRLR